MLWNYFYLIPPLLKMIINNKNNLLFFYKGMSFSLRQIRINVSFTLRQISIDSKLSESKWHSFLKTGFNDNSEGLRIFFFAFVDFQSIFQWKYPCGIIWKLLHTKKPAFYKGMEICLRVNDTLVPIQLFCFAVSNLGQIWHDSTRLLLTQGQQGEEGNLEPASLKYHH